MTEKEIYGYILTGITIFFGFILGLFADWIKNSKKRKELKNSVKTLIELEIEKNKKLIIEYWQIVSQHNYEWITSKNEFNYGLLAEAINDVPLPTISNIAWDKSINNLPIVYKSQELKDIWNVYDQFKTLNDIKEHLIFVKVEKGNTQEKIEHTVMNDRGSILGHIIHANYFDSDALSLSRSFKEIVERLIGIDTVIFANKT